MKKILIILISYLMISTSHADDVSKKVSEYISNIIPGEGLTETSIKLNDKDEDQIKFSILGLKISLRMIIQTYSRNSAWETKEVNSDGRIHGNLGIGYRKLTDDNSMMYGANTFIDADTFEGHRRLGYGLEAKASLLDLSLNRYQKITNMKTIDGTDEQILSGWDYYLTTQVHIHPGQNLVLKGYKWEGEKTSRDSEEINIFQIKYKPFITIELING